MYGLSDGTLVYFAERSVSLTPCAVAPTRTRNTRAAFYHISSARIWYRFFLNVSPVAIFLRHYICRFPVVVVVSLLLCVATHECARR